METIHEKKLEDQTIEDALFDFIENGYHQISIMPVDYGGFLESKFLTAYHPDGRVHLIETSRRGDEWFCEEDLLEELFLSRKDFEKYLQKYSLKEERPIPTGQFLDYFLNGVK